MSKRSDFKRRKNDEYDTPVKGMTPLLPYLKKGTKFIEPFAGKGNMVDFFEGYGHQCVGAFDIEPRREDITEMDVFDMHPHQFLGCDVILSNPPWTRKILHPVIDMLASIKPTILLFDADWAFTLQAAPYLEYCEKIVALPRLKWIEDSKYSGKDNCAYYFFDKEFKGQTQFYGR